MKKPIILLTAMLTFTTTVSAQIGSPSSDLVYTPVTPCRILDTRLAGGGTGLPIPAGGTSAYFTGGISSFAFAGGSATDCGLFTPGLNIAAVAINFVVVSPSAAGYITVYPSGSTRPTASTLNYAAGEVVANSAIVKVSQASFTAMSIFSLATTHVVADVTGYYSKPVVTALECQSTPFFGVSVPGGSNGSATAMPCPASYTSTGIYCAAGNADLVVTGFGETTCAAKNLGLASETLFARQRCCRIPGR
jgi:hypothetical protein